MTLRALVTLRAVVAVVALALPRAARAQAPVPVPAPAEDRGWDLDAFVGYAQHSPEGLAWGLTSDRDHLLLGLDLRALVLTLGRWRLHYAPSVTPIVRLSHHPSDGSVEPRRPTAYGVGLAPFGVAATVRITPRLQLSGASRVGFVWFDQEVPVELASRGNVSLEWGGTVEWRLQGTRRVIVGYKFLHVSNVYTALQNPGVDGHLLTLGYGLHWPGPAR